MADEGLECEAFCTPIPEETLSKGLFRWCAERAGTSQLSLYRIFLSKNVSGGESFDFVASMPDSRLQLLYREEKEEPSYFRFSNRGHLSRLFDLAGASAVIYEKAAPSTVVKRYDGRTWTHLLGEEGEKTTATFVITRRGREKKLWHVAGALPPLLRLPLVGEMFLVDQSHPVATVSRSARYGYFEALTSVLRKSSGPLFTSLPPEPKEEEEGEAPTFNLAEFCWNSDRLLAILRSERGDAARLLVVMYLGSDRYNEKTRQDFQVISDVGPSNAADVVVVCATACKRLYALAGGYAANFLPTLNERSKKKQELPPGEASAGGGRPMKDLLLPAANTRRRKKKKTMTREERERKTPTCDCSCCADAKKYFLNFGKNPCQRLYRQAIDFPQFMTIFNLDSRENLTRYRRACRLSYAVMDLETIRQEVAFHSGGAIGEDRFRCITDVRYETGIHCIQKVALIGHIDFLDAPVTSDAVGKIFRVHSDEQQDAVVADYIRYVSSRAERAAEMKRELLAPFISFVRAMERAHFDFFGEEEEVGGFMHSLVGIFKKKLDRFVRTYDCLAANGKRFDFPLLAAKLMAGGKSLDPPLQFVPMCRGNAICRLTVKRTGIAFKDPFDLFPANTSVDSLSRMLNLKMDGGRAETAGKLKVPFRYFTDYDKLLEPTLPKDLAIWHSELSGGTNVTQSDVDKAVRLFEEMQFPDIASYLIYYLHGDLYLLMAACEQVFDMFFALYGSDPVECQKMTVASFSSHLAQMYLFSHKRPGFTQPTIPVLYSLLKTGCLGGLGMVTRRRCSRAATDDPLNGHLDVRERENQARKVYESYQRRSSPASRCLDNEDLLPLVLERETGLEADAPYLSCRAFLEACHRAGKEGRGLQLKRLREGGPFLKGKFLHYLDISGLYSFSSE